MAFWFKKKNKENLEVVEEEQAFHFNDDLLDSFQASRNAEQENVESTPEKVVSEEVVSEEVISGETKTEVTEETIQETQPILVEASTVEVENAEPEVTIDSESSNESEEIQEEDTKEKKKGFFARLKEGLSKTRANIVSGFDNLFSSSDKIDDDFYEELEEILVMGDCGIHATEEIIEELKVRVKKEHIKKPAECKQVLMDSMKAKMDTGEITYPYEKETSIIFVIGVNGVGKTTSIGKLAAQLKGMGKKVTLAGADTFRAAAGDQLKMWADRVGVEMIGGKEGADPASVLYDAVASAKAKKSDVLIVDTAGRLHNKKNLMEELKKMNRVLDREYPGVIRENFIVLDGTTGQNALMQAREFKEAADLTGIILTKMDGTAKGGIAIAVTAELGIPVKYIGVGEKVEDLQKFDANAFIDALFDVELGSDEGEIENE